MTRRLRTRTRRTSLARHRRSRSPGTGRLRTARRSSSPRRSARRTFRTSRLGAGDRHPPSRQLNISNFKIPPTAASVSFQTSSPGSTSVYMRGVASGGDGTTRVAALGRHLSRRAAGNDDRRHSGRPHLRHRPDRKPRRAAGHALRGSSQVARPDHHQQARARSHERARGRGDPSPAHGERAQPRRDDQPSDRRQLALRHRFLPSGRRYIDNVFASAVTRRRGHADLRQFGLVENHINTRRLYGGRGAEDRPQRHVDGDPDIITNI